MITTTTLPHLQLLNSSKNCSTWQVEGSYTKYPALTAILIIFYVLLGIASFIGNLTVVLVILSREGAQFVTNIFIANLAFCDLVLILTSLWQQPVTIMSESWNFGPIPCVLSTAASGTGFVVSSFTLCAIAADRYCWIVHPLRGHVTKFQAFLWLGIIWAIGVVSTLPLIYHTQHIQIPSLCNNYIHAFCISNSWSPDILRVVHGVSILALQCIGPLVFIAICYTGIHWKLSEMHARFLNRPLEKRRESLVRNRKLQKILISMVVIFAVSSFPMNITNLVKDFDWYYYTKGPIMSMSTRQSVTAVTHLIAMTAMFWNPILYAWCNETLKYEIKCGFQFIFSTFPSVCLKGRRRNSDENQSRTIDSNSNHSHIALSTYTEQHATCSMTPRMKISENIDISTNCNETELQILDG